MISVDVIQDTAGVFKSCRITGHADAGPKGSDIVCAAVSVLSRTALKLLSTKEGVRIHSKAPKRGELWFEVEPTEETTPYITIVAAYLIEGIRSVAAEYPDNCTLILREERR